MSSTATIASVARAFSKQAVDYDVHDGNNLILQEWRQRVYDHLDCFLKPSSSILELNAGTGIDAIRFVGQGHYVHATDLSAGMIREIRNKIEIHGLNSRLTCERMSYDAIHVDGNKFDFLFSNFGGLNCIRNLSIVTSQFVDCLNEGGYVTLVIMPRICPWEWGMLLKGRPWRALRRFSRGGADSHLEGEYFKTFYHSKGSINLAMGPQFKLVKAECLGLFSPPPHRQDFPVIHRRLYRVLNMLDRRLGRYFPFNLWGDHIILTYQLRPFDK